MTTPTPSVWVGGNPIRLCAACGVHVGAWPVADDLARLSESGQLPEDPQ